MKKYIVTALIACAISTATLDAQNNSDTNKPATLIGLKDAFAGKFLIGTAADVPRGFSAAELANIKANYNIITPENSMKPQIQPSEGRFNWAGPDALVSWCQENNIKVWGHNLCWHSQTPAWFLQGTNGEPITRELAMEHLSNHIAAVAGHYKGKVIGWDVVNEAIDDRNSGQPDNLRNDSWYRVIGSNYLTMAFKWAHAADPDALLFYNDYNIEQGAVQERGKHAASMSLLKRMIADGAPINGVGIQGHWSLNSNLQDIDKAISDYESLGLKVAISELDVTIAGNNSGAFQVDAGGPAASDALQRQAEFYKKLFEIFDKHAKSISRVTLWGVDDRRSWRSGQRPLVFDGQLQPKPALYSIIDVGLGKTASP